MTFFGKREVCDLHEADAMEAGGGHRLLTFERQVLGDGRPECECDNERGGDDFSRRVNNRGRGPNERGCYDFLHGLGFTGEREIECRGSVGAVISSTVSTRETSTQTPDTRLLCGPSFPFCAQRGRASARDPCCATLRRWWDNADGVGMPRVTPLG